MNDDIRISELEELISKIIEESKKKTIMDASIILNSLRFSLDRRAITNNEQIYTGGLDPIEKTYECDHGFKPRSDETTKHIQDRSI